MNPLRGVWWCWSPLLALWLVRPAPAQEDIQKTAAALVTPGAERAIHQGLAFLVSRQHRDGSFGSGSYRGNAAICALGGMAFLSTGSTPERGPYGLNVSRCLDYLLGISQQSGFISAPSAASHGPMYGHGFATMFLAECYGMSPRPELRSKLRAAVKLIINTQNKEGGWRYLPRRLDADISVTVCQVMALRAARNCGVFVPRQTIDRAIEYVTRCQNADGGFMYMSQGGESAFARSAAGVVALYSAGVYEGPEIEKGIQYLMRFKPEPGIVRRETYYYYGHYYAVQAMWQAGGEAWRQWYPAIRNELAARQNPDGSWTSPISPEYATAMALIVLQIPNNCVPIFQK
ncbi:MAG TPA: prenyltransferase [Planctomycetaceae bacterium]|nr:prenyltransferase [Planctomycetaceae bacterium]HIQ22693.1 prenyltransferase [Planctomycetota bacterium]